VRSGILIGALIALLVLGPLPLLHGGSCAVVVRRHAPVVHHKEVVAVKEVVKAVVTPVVAVYQPVVVPLYSAIYQPGAYGGGQDQAVLEALKRISERLDRLERGPIIPPPSPPLPPTPPAPAPRPPAPPPVDDPFNPKAPIKAGSFPELAAQRCAACHDKGRPSGDFVMFEGGKLVQLTPEQVGDVIDAVVSQRMPRGQKMTDAERLAFVAALVGKK